MNATVLILGLYGASVAFAAAVAIRRRNHLKPYRCAGAVVNQKVRRW